MQTDKLKEVIEVVKKVKGFSKILDEALLVLIDMAKELKEIKEDYDHIINEHCSDDEKHCACVPALREENRKLKEELEEQKKFQETNRTRFLSMLYSKVDIEEENDQLKQRLSEAKETMKLKFGMWLCPKCGKGAPSGKVCRDCLEKRLAKIDGLTVEDVLPAVHEAFYDNGYGATPTVCPECRVDDFCHVEGCKNIDRELDVMIATTILKLVKEGVMAKTKIPQISLNADALKRLYDELCQARESRVEYELDNELWMARQAMFAKDKAINGIVNFLFNSGIQDM